MAKFIDSHGFGEFTPEQLKAAAKAPADPWGVTTQDVLFSERIDRVCCITNAPSKDAVARHHTQFNIVCEWIEEVKSAKD